MTDSFTTKRFALASLAEQAGHIVPSSASFQPVLQNFKIDVAPGLLRVTGTDMGLSMSVASPMVTAPAEFTFMVPARQLLEILREAPDGDLSDLAFEVSAPGEDLRQVRVTAGGVTWDLRVPDGVAYPMLPDISGAGFRETKREPFLAALKAVRHAVSRNTAQQQFAMVQVARAGDGSATVMAGDSARFASVHLPDFPLSLQIPAIGTPTAVDELIRLLGANDLPTVEVAVLERHLAFRAGSALFCTKRLSVTPADLERQFLKAAVDANTDALTVAREELVSAIRCARITADPETSAICLRLTTGQLTVISQDKHENGAAQSLAATWAGKDRQLVVNYRFLLDLLAPCRSATAEFLLGPDAKTRRPAVLIRDSEAGLTGVINQSAAGRFLGY